MANKPPPLKRSQLVRFLTNPWGRTFLIAFLVLSSVSVGVFTFYYHKYAKIIEETLRNGPFANTLDVVCRSAAGHGGRAERA